MYLKTVTFLLVLSLLSVAGQNGENINKTDKQGLKQGYWEKHYPNGKPAYQGHFKDGKPVGQMIRYYESGAKKAEMDFKNDGNTSYVTFFHENGNIAAIGKYINNEKDSVWSYYSYYEKNLQTRENYKNGKKHGKTLVYYESGQVYDETQWENGKLQGEWSQYFQNGNLKMRAYYENDMLHGSFNVYFDNNEPEIVGLYENNLRHGKWIFYNQEGEQLLQLDYEKGQVLNQEVLDEEQQKFFRQMEENMGKIQDPTIEDVFK
jgi:antitoxin component YwqK of YwqJK toxin-antitoxin module